MSLRLFAAYVMSRHDSWDVTLSLLRSLCPAIPTAVAVLRCALLWGRTALLGRFWRAWYSDHVHSRRNHSGNIFRHVPLAFWGINPVFDTMRPVPRRASATIGRHVADFLACELPSLRGAIVPAPLLTSAGCWRVRFNDLGLGNSPVELRQRIYIFANSTRADSKRRTPKRFCWALFLSNFYVLFFARDCRC